LGDEESTPFEQVQVGFECGSVHCHQDVALVAGGKDFGAAETELEAGDSSQRALWGADFGRVVRERGKIVARQCAGMGKVTARQLHALAGIPSEDNRHIATRRCAVHLCCNRKAVEMGSSANLRTWTRTGSAQRVFLCPTGSTF
jgi:hypothetical protein